MANHTAVANMKGFGSLIPLAEKKFLQRAKQVKTQLAGKSGGVTQIVCGSVFLTQKASCVIWVKDVKGLISECVVICLK